MMPMQVTTGSFEREVIQSTEPVVIDFWAEWCAPCRALSPILETLASEWQGKVKVVKVNVDEEPALAQAFKIRSIPTIVAMRGSQVADVQLGLSSPEHLGKLFKRLAKKGPVPQPHAT